MQNKASELNNPTRDAEEYIENLQALGQELDRAMEAIVAGSLPQFEESLSRQRTSCAKLTHIGRHYAERKEKHAATPGDPINQDLADRLAAAARELGRLNQRYSLLLRHSGENLRVLSGLFRGYGGPPSHVGNGAQNNLSTWSCEL